MSKEKVYSISDEKFIELFEKSASLRSFIIITCGHDSTNDYKIVRERCKQLNLDLSKIKTYEKNPELILNIEDVKNVINNSSTLKECTDKLNIKYAGNNITKFKHFCATNDISLLKLTMKYYDTITDAQIIELCKSNISSRDVVLSLGLSYCRTTTRWISDQIKRLSISINHWPQHKQTDIRGKRYTLEEICIENSSFSGSKLRKRILKEKALIYECQLCGQSQIWNSKQLTLQLDHINGICNDNRLENLRFLCPNCHSQTETFGGRNFKFAP